MITYLALNLIFLAVTLMLLRRFLPRRTTSWWLTLGSLLLLTVVFDNMIVGLNIVAYDPSKLLGVYVYKAPVEDFFYAVLAVFLVPALWTYFGIKKGSYANAERG